MKMLIALLCLAIAGCASGAPQAAQARAEAELAQALQGRVAGEPRNCVTQRLLGNAEGYGEAILFRGSGGTFYLSKTRGPCMTLGPTRALVTYPTGSQLCEGDRVGVADLTTGASYGMCEIGAFTPYARPR